MNPRKAALIAWLAAACLGLSACQHVAPYQREALARPGMDVKEREALSSQFYTHVYEAREGAMPSSEHAGGGCGCN
ncbi:MAG: DUF4266 domain-containing protein [Polyangiales bacterium]